MPLATEHEMAHIGENRGIADHDHDLVHELSKRLDAYWRYDQRIANAEGRPDLQQFWREVKAQDEENIQRLKKLISDECAHSCF